VKDVLPQSGSVSERRFHNTSYSWYLILHYGALRTIVSTMNARIAFLRRLGPDPHANGAQTAALLNCPDIFELEDGDFAIIGINITELASQLPPSASCGPDERMVRVPRKTLILAKPDIPDRV
jgi:hypothetical protein